jgi:hypothetical protein
MGRIGRGWKLAKMSLSIIRKDKEILIFPILSALITVMILASFIVAMFLSGDATGSSGDAPYWTFVVFFAAFYFIAFFVSIFFNAAVIGCATIRMNGGDPTVSDGLRIAGENIKQILLWAIFAATVGLILRAIQQRVGLIGKILIGGLGVAFSIATYFVVPVFIYEKLGPWASLKRSVSILKTTWGEALVANFGLGLIFVLFGLLGIVPILIGVAIMSFWSVVVGVIIAVVYWLVLGVIASAAGSVLLAALYRYATTGKISEEFQGVSFDNPWAG